jgi:hypothetical protein
MTNKPNTQSSDKDTKWLIKLGWNIDLEIKIDVFFQKVNISKIQWKK